MLTNQFLINQKDVKNELHNRKTGEEYLREVVAVNKKVSKKKKAERLNSGLER